MGGSKAYLWRLERRRRRTRGFCSVRFLKDARFRFRFVFHELGAHEPRSASAVARAVARQASPILIWLVWCMFGRNTFEKRNDAMDLLEMAPHTRRGGHTCRTREHRRRCRIKHNYQLDDDLNSSRRDGRCGVELGHCRRCGRVSKRRRTSAASTNVTATAFYTLAQPRCL